MQQTTINDLGQIIDESGQVKCLDEKGNVKWFAPIVANNTRLMNQQGMFVFISPKKFEPEVKAKATESANENTGVELKSIDDYTRDQLKEEITKLNGTFKPADGKESLYNTLKQLQTK